MSLELSLRKGDWILKHANFQCERNERKTFVYKFWMNGHEAASRRQDIQKAESGNVYEDDQNELMLLTERVCHSSI